MMYQINVSKNNMHYFATEANSLQTERNALEMLAHFRSIFPKKDGFSLSLYKIQKSTILLDQSDLVSIKQIAQFFVVEDRDGLFVTCGKSSRPVFDSKEEALAAANFSGYTVIGLVGDL